MKHTEFLVWMFVYPVISEITHAIAFKFGGMEDYCNDLFLWSRLVFFLIYIAIAFNLWN